MISFAHLRIHTMFSFLYRGVFISDLFKRADTLNIPALAITDLGNMYGVPEFLKYAKKYPRIKPIIGCEVNVTNPNNKTKNSYYQVILLAKNYIGYKNLMRIVSESHINSISDKPSISRDFIERHSDGLICISSFINGEVTSAILCNDKQKADKIIKKYKSVFGDDYYLEVTKVDSTKGFSDNNWCDKQYKFCETILDFANEYDVRVIATNDVFTLQDLKSSEDMLSIFINHPEVVINTMEIVNKIESYSINRDVEIPLFDINLSELELDIYLDRYKDIVGHCDCRQNSAAYLCHLTFVGAEEKYGNLLSEHCKERLEYELRVICKKGYQDYFLIVQDLVKAMTERNVLIGPGRSSTPGSAVAFCLGITQIDPIKHNLLFESFLRYGKIRMPNIDIDVDNRNEAISYLQMKYGYNHVAKAIAFEETSDKYNKETRISPFIGKTTIIIGREPIAEYVPITLSKRIEMGDDCIVTQYDCNHVEDSGLVCQSIINLPALSLINNCLNLIRDSRKEDISIYDIPLDDPKTYRIYASNDVVGVFLSDSINIEKCISYLKPSNMGDLMLMLSVYYQDTMMDYLPIISARKEGKIPIIYTLPEMEEFLSETFGFIFYREQLMFLSIKFGGFSQDDADLLQRAIIFKQKHVLDELKDKFIAGGGSKGYNNEVLNHVWDDLRKFGVLTSHKSHIACYALISYCTAWLKCHHPVEFHMALRQNLYYQDEV